MLRMLFEKSGTAVWMSHLDTMRLMQRAFRRAGVVLHHSQGFTPHAYVSMILPLSVGVSSQCEIMEYALDTELTITPEEMNAVLPQGVRILSVYESDRKGKELSLLKAEVTLEYDHELPQARLVQELFEKDELLVEKRTKRGIEETDIKPMIYSCRVESGQGRLSLECVVAAQNPSLNPMLLAAAVEKYLPQCKPDHVTVTGWRFLMQREYTSPRSVVSI